MLHRCPVLLLCFVQELAPCVDVLSAALVDLAIFGDRLVVGGVWDFFLEGHGLQDSVMPLESWIRVLAGIVFAAW